jgi:hypothetical protein
MIWILEDLLRACKLEFKGSWEDHLLLVEFTYNNNYQATIGMTPYEALYGRKCEHQYAGKKVGDRQLFRSELVQVTLEKIKIIKDRMKETYDRQKSYADNRRRPLEIGIGDKVFLKVAQWKHMLRFGMKGKLAPRYMRPFEVSKRIGVIAYKLALPP